MTKHTTHFDDCGCAAKRHEAEIAEYRQAAIDGATYWQAKIDAAVREADRLRHGVAIEGDFVCPDALEVTALRAEVARLRTALTGTRAVLDELDPHPESIVGRVLTLVEKALKEAGDGNRET